MMHCYCGVDKTDISKMPDSNDYLCRDCMKKHIAFLKKQQSTENKKDETKISNDGAFTAVFNDGNERRVC